VDKSIRNPTGAAVSPENRTGVHLRHMDDGSLGAEERDQHVRKEKRWGGAER
jgi:hypothetical protein